MAIRVVITSCSRCRMCGAVLFDEEIMAGWTPEDRNFNTKCVFCERLTVPSLTCTVTDYRANPPMTRPEGAASSPPEGASGDVADPLVAPHPPVVHPTITVPYISPLVLRRELESVLAKDGDVSLTSPDCPALYPIIYWNLLYYFHRTALPSHLPGLLLQPPPQLLHPGWSEADYTNVRVATKWDNPDLYREGNLPLYVQWRQRNCHSNPRDMHPLMHKVIQGVKENDLHQCVKDIVNARVRRREDEKPVVLDPRTFLSTYRWRRSNSNHA